MKLATLRDDWLASLRTAGAAANTARAATSDTGLFLAWLGRRGRQEAEDVTRDDIASWFAAMATRGLSVRTRRRRAWTVETFVSWGKAHFAAGVADATEHPSVPRRPREWPRPSEAAVERAIAVALSSRARCGVKVAAVIALGTAGVTAAEMVAMDVVHVSPAGGLVTVWRKGEEVGVTMVGSARKRAVLAAGGGRASGPLLINKFGARLGVRSVARFARLAAKLAGARPCPVRGMACEDGRAA